MSSSLVKRSLALFEDDLKEPAKKKKKLKDPMLAISTKKKGVRKELERLKKQERNRTRRKDAQLPVYNDSGYYDYTDTSVEILKRISQLDSANKLATSTITEHHQKKRGKKKANLKDDESKEEESAFSEKDFENFSKEYDFSKLKKT